MMNQASMTRCSDCGSLPGECYSICPTQDPYHGNPYQEAMDYEASAQADYISEAYGDTGDCYGDYDNEDPVYGPIFVMGPMYGPVAPEDLLPF